MSKYQILVVEDDAPVRNLITTTLKAHDYRFISAVTGESAVMETATHNPDIILLDLGLPDIDGVEVIERIRSWSNVPIIVISARSEDTDKIDALDAGADDYLVKPFAFDELLARLRVLLRRKSGAVSDVITIADLVVDCAGRTVERAGRPVTLSSKEFAVLEYLARNSGVVLSREKISRHIWNYDYEGGSNVVDVYIRYLRKKLDEGFEPKLIHTVRGAGYVLRVDA